LAASDVTGFTAVTAYRTAALAFPAFPRYLPPFACIDDPRLTGPPVPGGCPQDEHEGQMHVAKVNPGEFFRQVRAETAKVVWPTRKETVTRGIMVAIMTTLLALFFFGVDSAFSAIVQALLGLLS
jgi:preprotein translocase subunit SecE